MEEGFPQELHNMVGGEQADSADEGAREMESSNSGILSHHMVRGITWSKEQTKTQKELLPTKFMSVGLGFFAAVLVMSKLWNQAIMDKVPGQKVYTLNKDVGFKIGRDEGIIRRIVACSVDPKDCTTALSGSGEIRCKPQGWSAMIDAEEIFSKCENNFNVYLDTRGCSDYICGAGLGSAQQIRGEDKWTYDNGRITVDCTGGTMWGSVTGLCNHIPNDVQPLPSCFSSGCSKDEECADYLCCHTGHYLQNQGGTCNSDGAFDPIWSAQFQQGYCDESTGVVCSH